MMSKFLVCVVIVVVVVAEAAVVKERESGEKLPYELDELLNGTFRFKSWNGSWFSDNQIVYNDEDGNFLLYNLDQQTWNNFLSHDIVSNYQNSKVNFSPDNAYMLIKYNETLVFRHSSTAQYAIYDIANKKYYDIANKQPLQLVAFSPKGHSLAYVLENNIYLLEDFYSNISDSTTVTNIGIPGILYCGVPDWVYEEEVLRSATALWFSPNGTHLAYATFNDEDVPTYSYITYGEPGSIRDQYPQTLHIKYPKVGQNNPLVQIYLYDISTKTTLEFRLPPSINNKVDNDFVLYGMVWISESEVALVTTNRVQNQSFITRCHIDGDCMEEATYVQKNGWLEPKLPKYSLDGLQRLEILPQPEGDDHFFHLVLTDVETKQTTRLTHGRRSVNEINGWDQQSGLIYFGATVNDIPSRQHVYAVSLRGQQKCLSCSMEAGGEKCTYASASFSPQLAYHTKVCRGPGLPLTVVEKTTNTSHVIVWEDNASWIEKLRTKQQPLQKNFEIPVGDNFKARARLWLPPNLDESKKYPAIVFAYAGPGYNQIHDVFAVTLFYYLVTKREYIYIQIDGRGSGRDGLKKMFQMYRRFGTVEVDDQITVTKYLQDHVPYIDAERTGIWGWSYGGFTASWALAKDKDHVFNFALAVAPVINFIYYDTLYTERYMGLPSREDNEAGYNNTDLTRVVEDFRGRRYFIIHGTGDDNVHFQNAALLIKALSLADIDFKQQSYPDENHQLRHVTNHLYHTLDKYFARCFDVEGPRVTSWNNKDER